MQEGNSEIPSPASIIVNTDCQTPKLSTIRGENLARLQRLMIASNNSGAFSRDPSAGTPALVEVASHCQGNGLDDGPKDLRHYAPGL